MPALVEHIAVEFAVTLSVGAVLGFVSGLLSTDDQADQGSARHCRRCGSIAPKPRPH
jgi:hypothetical protein